MNSTKVVVATLTTAATVAVAVTLAREWRRRKERQFRQTERILRKFARECATPVPKLWEVANALVSDMESCLSSESSSLNMIVSYVAPLPNGDEKGLYYGVNLRGDDFLLLCARLEGKNEPVSGVHREEFPIPNYLMSASSKELCNYIALELAKFVAVHPDTDNEAVKRDKKIGFTLLYPVDQTVPTSGSVVKWKSLSGEESMGLDNINEALEKHGIQMRVYGLVDDTIGDLAGGRYYNKDSVVAVTLGMRTNAAYIDQAQSVPSWHGSGEIVISTEWGDFNSCHLPLSEFDHCLDAESSNPGCRIFEKLISGTYLGEIVRRVLLRMAHESALFGESVPQKLNNPYLLRSPDMAAMHQDTSEDREIVHEKLKDIFGISDSTPMAREVVAEVCDIVTERGARLAGAAIVGIIKKLGRLANRKHVVTIEGGLYEHYRVFRNYLNSSVWEMLGDELSDNVLIERSHGGPGAGAIFLAASQTPYT